MYVRKHPKLKIRIVDGSSLAAAVVVHSIPVGTREVLFRGQITKVARAIVTSLCQNGIKVPIYIFNFICFSLAFNSYKYLSKGYVACKNMIKRNTILQLEHATCIYIVKISFIIHVMPLPI